MLQEFMTGIRHFLSAGSFLKKHGLLYFYLIPLLLALVFYISLASVIFRYAESAVHYFMGPYIPEKLPEFDGFFSFFNFVREVSLYGIIAVVAGVTVFLVSLKLSKYLILIILSPVFSILSEKVEEKVLGVQYPFSTLQFIKDIFRGSFIALRNLMLELILIALFSIIGLFAGPLAFLISPFLWIIGAYFYGFSMLDYTCERRRMGIRESVAFIRRHRFFVLGVGIMYALLDSIPFLGMAIAPVNGVCGASGGILELESGDRVS